MKSQTPDRQQILDMAAGFQEACVIGAAAELDLFSILGGGSLSAGELADRLGADARATAMLLDAVAALRLLEKRQGQYRVPADLLPLLTEASPQSILPMLWHRINILRGWSQLARVVKTGAPGPRPASIRGAEADRQAFIGAMHTVSGPGADELVARLGPPRFAHLLDVGGASGTWTLAFLRAVAGARATIFDLPDAIDQARDRIAGGEQADRIALVVGDFYADALPDGADFAWVSAIVHQHSRQHNRELFAKVHAALQPGGRIAIRDAVMAPSRTAPVFGAMFAINMLTNTDSGGTFTFDELAEDLRAAGFVEPVLPIEDEAMNSVVMATKPAESH
ncbi:MAG: methyltransferase domain-containing protein [Pirellulales bacterium]|nr:methyltransferase domain-containing protein [Pirellulales bacterium]